MHVNSSGLRLNGPAPADIDGISARVCACRGIPVGALVIELHQLVCEVHLLAPGEAINDVAANLRAPHVGQRLRLTIDDEAFAAATEREPRALLPENLSAGLVEVGGLI